MQALIKGLSGLVLVGLFLFLSAGTFEFWNAWLFIILLFVPMLILGVVLLFKAPELLKKRLNNREKEGAQKKVVSLTAFIFVIGFVLTGLDFRFGWSKLPLWSIIVASVLFLIGYGLYAEVMRENAYLSRTVEVQENQKVIDTGLYGIVRHPMYFATILLFLAMPIVLGSWIAFIIFLNYPVLIAKRIRNEEEILEKGLEGYSEYKQKVKYRIFPFIW